MYPCVCIVEPSDESATKIADLMTNKFFSQATVHFTQAPSESVSSIMQNAPNTSVKETFNVPFVPKFANVILLAIDYVL